MSTKISYLILQFFAVLLYATLVHGARSINDKHHSVLLLQTLLLRILALINNASNTHSGCFRRSSIVISSVSELQLRKHYYNLVR